MYSHAHWRRHALPLAAIVLAAFNLRTAITSLTPLLESLGTELHFGTGTASILGMLPPAAFAMFAFATPGIVSRIGLERSTIAAMALAAVGMVLRALVDSSAGLVATSMIALAGMGIGNVVLPPLVKRYFPERIGATSAAYITAMQLGTMLPAFVAVPMAVAWGWRLSLGAWALPALVALAPLLLLARSRSPRRGIEPPQPAVAIPGGRPVWRSALAWEMGLLMGMASLITYALFTWLPRWMTEAGASAEQGGALLGLYSAVGLLSSVLVPPLVARMRRPFLLALAITAFFVPGFAGLAWMPERQSWLWISLLGMAGAIFPMALTLINLRTRTPAGSAALSGFMQSTGYAIACAGPLAVGLLREWSGGWGAAVAFLSLCAVVLLWSAWRACLPRWLEDGPAPR